MKATKNADKLVVAFFGRDLRETSPRPLIESWWKFADEISSAVGMSFSHVDASFLESGTGLANNRPYALASHKAPFLSQVARNNVSTLGLNAIHGKGKYIAFDWLLTANCGVDPRYGAIALLGIDMDVIVDWSKSKVLAILEESAALASEYIQIPYGFAILMPKNYSPASYAMGIAPRHAENWMLHDATAWRRFARRASTTLLRNVYGWNLLNQHHLALNVDSCSLDSWISRSPALGKLRPLRPLSALWTFEDVSPNLEFLRCDFETVKKVRQTMEQREMLAWQSSPK